MTHYYEIQAENGDTLVQECSRELAIEKAQSFYDERVEEPCEKEVKLFAVDNDGEEGEPEYLTIFAGDWDGEFSVSDYAQHSVWNKAQMGVR